MTIDAKFKALARRQESPTPGSVSASSNSRMIPTRLPNDPGAAMAVQRMGGGMMQKAAAADAAAPAIEAQGADLKNGGSRNMPKAIIPTVAPAILASALLVLASAWESAETAPVKNSCEDRYNACAKRCVERYIDSFKKTGRDQTMSCFDRSCAPQKRNCEEAQKTPKAPKASGGVKDTGGGVATDPKSPAKWHGPTSQPKGGHVARPGIAAQGRHMARPRLRRKRANPQVRRQTMRRPAEAAG